MMMNVKQLIAFINGTLLELSAVIITERAMPEPNVIEKANQEGITLLPTVQPSFYIGGRLWELGVRIA